MSFEEIHIPVPSDGVCRVTKSVLKDTIHYFDGENEIKEWSLSSHTIEEGASARVLGGIPAVRLDKNAIVYGKIENFDKNEITLYVGDSVRFYDPATERKNQVYEHITGKFLIIFYNEKTGNSNCRAKVDYSKNGQLLLISTC